MPHPSRTPEILMTPPLSTAASSAEQDVTVVPLPLPPPVAPDAYPTSPSMAAEPHVLVAVEVAFEVVVAALEVVVEVVVVAPAEPVK